MKGNVRNVKGEAFTAVPQSTVIDSNLSNAQLGFLTRLLSKPETWEYHPKQIAGEFDMSLRTVHNMFDLLAGKGYIVRHDTRMQDDKGRWTRSVEYKVYASLKLRLEDDDATERKILRSVKFKDSTEDRKHAFGA
jgi:hypothetical protein